MQPNPSQRPLEQTLEYIKGVGPQRADILKKELSIFTMGDLLMHIPFRYVDKTLFHKIKDINIDSDFVQLRGVVREMEIVGENRARRLVAKFRDTTGMCELVWFQSITSIEKMLQIGSEYIVYGKPTFFGNKYSIPHPEIEVVTEANTVKALTLEPVYHTTEQMKTRHLDSKAMRKIQQAMWQKLTPEMLIENLPDYLIQRFKFPSRYEAFRDLHFPANEKLLTAARNRLKFEELFFMQLKILQAKGRRNDTQRGMTFDKVGDYFLEFYNEKLPFQLTEAQKRVMREIRKDVGTGKQMNRLVQGDVGSGKTIVALMAMLLALDNGHQACLMAPTEILATQHFESLCQMMQGLKLKMAILTGSVKGRVRRQILEALEAGELHILIGTHALIEDTVVFKSLGMAVIDEQHRFGVQQRSRLWKKNAALPPHILVMSATPIPRTLAMTVYGDLEVSVIDELPPGRKPISTLHKYDNQRERVMGFMREEIEKGRQCYVVYPLIEESEKLDLQNLMTGYAEIESYFPQPKYHICIVHGKMKPADKDFEMQRFIKGEAQIMVATTVIEVGVNVPNASVMVIENTERFGLAQLHQLRGRVGRGADQSFCILMSSYKLSTESRTRIETMCRTNNGFEIAEVDMQLRGAGNIEGTQQSGILNFKLADLSKDGNILRVAREVASEIIQEDLELVTERHLPLKAYFEREQQQLRGWAKIS